jgi:hypothetical protein
MLGGLGVGGRQKLVQTGRGADAGAGDAGDAGEELVAGGGAPSLIVTSNMLCGKCGGLRNLCEIASVGV